MNINHSADAGPIVVHVDGSCLGNPGNMGWAHHIQRPDGSITEGANGAPFGTNNKAELMAAIGGLSATPTGSTVTIITDSDYLRRGATEWVSGWIKKGWTNAKKKPVKNKDLWLELLALIETREVTFERVAGHSGDPLNDRVDVLARAAAEDSEAWKHV